MATQLIPRNLQVFLNTLGAGYAKSAVKLFPQGKQGPYGPGEFTRIVLPENSIVDLHSLNLMFNIALTGTKSSFTDYVSLPKHSSSLLSRVNVYVGGIQVGLNSVTEYNTLYNALANVTIGEDKQTEMSVLEAGADAVAPTAAFTTRRLAINNWLGFLDGTMARFIDTSLTGPIIIELQWAPSAVLIPQGTDMTGQTFSATDVYLLVETVSFEGALYSNLLLSKMASGQPLQLPFRNWALLTSSTSTTGGTIPFSVNSRSIDLLAMTLRPSDYDSTQKTLPSNTTNSNYFRFFSDGSNTQFQWTVNGKQMPQWQASTADAYVLTRQAFDGGSGNRLFTNNVQSLSRWENGHFLFAVGLSHHTSPDDHLMSGLDTQGTNTSIYATYSGGATSGGTRPVIIAGLTSVLEIWPGKAVQYVQ